PPQPASRRSAAWGPPVRRLVPPSLPGSCEEQLVRFVVVGNERLTSFPAAEEVLPALQSAYGALRLRDYAIIEAEVGPEPAIVGAIPNPSLGRDGQVAMAAAAAGLGYTDLLMRVLDEAWARHVAVAPAAKTA